MSSKLGPSEAVVRAAEKPPGEVGSTAIPWCPWKCWSAPPIIVQTLHSWCRCPSHDLAGEGIPRPAWLARRKRPMMFARRRVADINVVAGLSVPLSPPGAGALVLRSCRLPCQKRGASRRKVQQTGRGGRWLRRVHCLSSLRARPGFLPSLALSGLGARTAHGLSQNRYGLVSLSLSLYQVGRTGVGPSPALRARGHLQSSGVFALPLLCKERLGCTEESMIPPLLGQGINKQQ